MTDFGLYCCHLHNNIMSKVWIRLLYVPKGVLSKIRLSTIHVDNRIFDVYCMLQFFISYTISCFVQFVQVKFLVSSCCLF